MIWLGNSPIIFLPIGLSKSPKLGKFPTSSHTGSISKRPDGLLHQCSRFGFPASAHSARQRGATLSARTAASQFCVSFWNSENGKWKRRLFSPILRLNWSYFAPSLHVMSSMDAAPSSDDSLYPIAVLIDELRNEDVQVREDWWQRLKL